MGPGDWHFKNKFLVESQGPRILENFLLWHTGWKQHNHKIFLNKFTAISQHQLWRQSDAAVDLAFFGTTSHSCFLGTCCAGCLSVPGTCGARGCALKSSSHLLLSWSQAHLPPNSLLPLFMPNSNLTSSGKASLPLGKVRVVCSELHQLVSYALSQHSPPWDYLITRLKKKKKRLSSLKTDGRCGLLLPCPPHLPSCPAWRV